MKVDQRGNLYVSEPGVLWMIPRPAEYVLRVPKV